MIYMYNADNSNKFWRYDTDQNNNTTISWGRIGTAGQSMATSLSQAKFKASKKVNEGYYPISDSQFELFTKISKGIGTANKIVQTKWVDHNGKSVSPSELDNPNYNPRLLASIDTAKFGSIIACITSDSVKITKVDNFDRLDEATKWLNDVMINVLEFATSK